MFAAVLFDLDETLIADEPVSREAFFTTSLELTGDATRARALARAAEEEARGMGRELAESAIAYCQRIGHSPLEALWATYDSSIPEEVMLERDTARLRPELWVRALKACGERGDPAHLARRWASVRAQYPLFDDVNAVLARLRPKTKLGIVTNGVSGLQRKKLEGCGLLHWFDAVAISGEVRIGKPERGIFDFVAKELGVPVGECLMVGDNAERDVQGGINAGMKTCWVDRGFRPRSVKADLEVKSLTGVCDWALAR